MVESVASIRSAILHEASRNLPSPLQRATDEANRTVSPVARGYLAGTVAIENQILVTRLDADIASALVNVANVQAAYGASVALIGDARTQTGGTVSVTA